MTDLHTLPSPKYRNIFFSEDVTPASIRETSKKIIEVNEHDSYLKELYKLHDLDYTPKPVKIYIDSYGGWVYQILGLVSVMDSSKTPIHTICTGTAQSAGFIMLISGHKRFAHKHSTMMYHQASGGARGKVKDLEEEIVEIKRLQASLEEITLSKTKITEKHLKKVYNKKFDWIIDTKEALKLGVIDEII